MTEPNRPLRALYLAHNCGRAGAQLNLLRHLTRLDRSKFDPQVVLPYEDGPLAVELAKLDVPLHRRPFVPWIDFSKSRPMGRLEVSRNLLSGLKERVWGVAGLIDRLGIDLVNTNTVTPLDGALAARVTRRPHVWHIHESIVDNDELFLPLLPGFAIDWAISRLSSAVICVSERVLRESYPITNRSGKAAVIHNGVDCQRFRPDPSASDRLKRDFGIPAEAAILGICGILFARKDQATLLRAIPEIQADVVVLIIGDGPERGNLERLAKQLNIESRVRFLGLRNDVDTLLPGLDVFVLSSRSEALPLSILEAMAAGIPVVSTRCGGIEECVEDGVTGAVVDIGDHRGMAAAIDNLLRSPGGIARFGEAARRHASTHFDSVRQQNRVESVLYQAWRDHAPGNRVPGH